MDLKKIYPVSKNWSDSSHINKTTYEELYKKSIEDPESFWAEQAQTLKWITPFKSVKNTSFNEPVNIEWFKDGELNIAENCLDRHLETRGDQIAFIWEPEDMDQPTVNITYKELHKKVCQMANIYKKYGVKKGDRVTLYMPMIPEATYAMLACARIGAIHSVVFAGFSPDSLSGRINDCQSEFVITADFGRRGGKLTALKENVDATKTSCSHLKKVFVVKHVGDKIAWDDKLDVCINTEIETASADCAPEAMNAEDPLFILYTSGSTSKPKGVYHTTGGYLLYAALTHKYVFDYQEGDIYWCAADIGWVTGHSYIVYGPLANGATSVMYEGVPTYPTASRIWQIIDEHKVNILYTAPTLIRALMGCGNEFVDNTSRSTLKLLGSVGEPINPEAWHWYYESAGDNNCPIMDTWWQTETGGILITPLPGATDLKPGSATRPFFGIQPEILDEKGNVLEGACEGLLAINDSWPGQMRGLYKNPKRFYETYFSTFKGKYFTGDGCRRDKDGDYWITGRVDDVINVSGHRMGTAEIESALVAHHEVSEAAVVGMPHDIKGQGIYAYVTLMSQSTPSEDLKKELVQWVRKEIGPIATPDKIQWAPQLPKTRSGKIMRRILRKIAENQIDQFGDVSTLADPSVVKSLVEHRI